MLGVNPIAELDSNLLTLVAGGGKHHHYHNTQKISGSVVSAGGYVPLP